ncbi:SDR family NAD(P)-dependent oxidoreductase [Chloroflexota bacterium]
MRLDNKVAIITGSGSGIGQATAILFAKEGARVIVNSMHEKSAQSTIDLIKAEDRDARFVLADVTRNEQVKNLIEFAIKTYGKLDILVNNVGLSLRGKGDWSIADVAEPIWDKTLDVNLKSVYLCCKYAIPYMAKLGGSSIVNVSTVDALIAHQGGSYVAAKGGMVTLTKSIAVAYAQDNIRANVVCPGPTETAGARKILKPEMESIRLPYIPLRRLAQSIEVAYAILFFASDESSYITGTVLPVDGGETAGRPLWF